MTSARLPLVALVGRPNVGKSTLFNRLLGRRAAITDPEPGVTRDRHFGVLHWAGRQLRIVDTGGFDSGAGSLTLRIREQTELAIDEADLVVLVLDVTAGAQASDHDVVALLRRAGKPMLVVANKADLPQHDAGVADLYTLGLDDILPLSAEHGRGVGELCERLCERLEAPKEEVRPESSPVPPPEDEPPSHIEWTGGAIKVAVVGRPNVGKSSLINRLLGEERLLASELPGTTRDAIDTELLRQGQHFVLIDTAGVRRKRSIAQRVERFAVMAAVRSLERADIAVLVVDASGPLADQDAKIAALAIDRGVGLIVAANKWDLVRGEEGAELFADSMARRLVFAGFARAVRVSAKNGRGLDALLDAIVEVQEERHRRIGTGELNRFFTEVVASHPPPASGTKRPRLYYVTQPHVAPPTFIVSASRASGLPPAYLRFLENSLRDRYGFGGTPIWLKLRPRSPEPKTSRQM